MARKSTKQRASKRSSTSKRVTNPTKTAQPTTAQQPLPNSFRLTAQVFSLFNKHWRQLLGVVVVYLALNIIFASGLSDIGAAVNNIKTNLDNSTGTSHTLAKAISGFGSLVGSSGTSGNSSASVLQSALFVIESLVIIWALRHLLAGQGIGVKQAYYNSMYPLIPFLLVLVVIFLQLLPISLGALIVTAVTTSDIATLGIATWLAWLVFLGLSAWSFYMLSSSIFAIYIVTLPDVLPRNALRSAKKLVSGRRWRILPRLVYLPVFIIAAMAVIIIPLIIFASLVVAPVFFILSMLAILFVHSYLYLFYRSMLHD